MKLATTIGDFLPYTGSASEAVRAYEGTGFRHLDYSFYNTVFPKSPFLGDNWMQDVRDAGREAEKLGFDFVQAHSPGTNPFDPRADYATVVKANRRAIEACSYLGIRKIVVHPGFSEDYRYPGDKMPFLEANRRFFGDLLPAAERFGVSLLAENSAAANMGGKYFPMTGEELREFADFCGEGQVGACWDVGHANMQDPDQYKDIVALGDRLSAVHIQDNFGKADDHIAPLMGTLDVDAVMRGLIDNGFPARGGYFTFEADNVVSRGGWPNARNASQGARAKIPVPTLAVKKEAIRLLFVIGKEILSAYDCFED